MALTDKQKNTLHSNLRNKISGACPMCGGNQWSLSDELVAPPALSLGGGLAIGGPAIPMLQLVCTNCGFVSHHAVGMLGFDLG